MILVTGANGFLGSYVCRKLYSENVPFIALVRPSSNLDLLHDIRDNITFYEGDILDPDGLVEIIDKIEVIIHCAAIVSFTRKDRHMMNEVNITGTKNMVDLAMSHNIKYFIHISSVAALGRNTLSGSITEKNKWQNSKWNSRYGESKYLAELEVWRGIMEGLQAVILNPSVILGPGDWHRSSARLFKYVWDENSFYSEGSLNYIDVRDVVDIIFLFLNQQKRVSGERYILNTDTIDYKSFFEQIAQRLNKKAPAVKASPLLIELALLLQKIKSLLSNSKPLISRESARLCKSKIYFDNSKIKSKLNHNFVPLTQTIDWTCGFYLEENSLKNK